MLGSRNISRRGQTFPGYRTPIRSALPLRGRIRLAPHATVSAVENPCYRTNTLEPATASSDWCSNTKINALPSKQKQTRRKVPTPRHTTYRRAALVDPSKDHVLLALEAFPRHGASLMGDRKPCLSMAPPPLPPPSRVLRRLTSGLERPPKVLPLRPNPPMAKSFSRLRSFASIESEYGCIAKTQSVVRTCTCIAPELGY